jgi:hypothetical protein
MGDLAAVRARLENDRLHAHRILRESAENHRRYPWVTLEAQDFIDILAAYDAQADRLAAVESIVEAARAWGATFTTGPAQEPWFTPWQALRDAVRALDAAGEGRDVRP